MKYKYKKPDPFYLSKPWRKVRAVALARDHHLCQHCLKRGRLKTAELVHHIKPLETHPDLGFTLDNLLSLCNACHNRVHGYGQGRGEATLTRARIIKG
ncbi:MAG: HNH endonuclease [Bacillota bacterium]|nr:HNH endonuclease [Bacillota bacterium]